MNRIDKKFKELGKKKALIVYITAGDPNLSTTKKLIFELEKSKVDIIELGIPFSDPLADGPTIQAASSRALKNNVSLKDVIGLVRDVRKNTQIPVAFMTYYNPVFRMGIENFVTMASEAGVDGVIIPDLPPEEAADIIKISKRNNFADIFLLAPTSTAERIKNISKKSKGFIYYVSLTGTTGARKSLPVEIKGNVRKIKRYTNKPVCVGFGVSTPKQARDMARIADGVIVGSAVIKIVENNLNKKSLVRNVGKFVRSLANAIHKA